MYEEAIRNLVTHIAEVLPRQIDPEVIRDTQDKIDANWSRDCDFDAARFPRSFVETYRKLAHDQSATPSPLHESHCYNLGATVMNARPSLLPHARELLADVKTRCQLWLYTLGVPETQLPKVTAHALEPYFDEIHVVPRKNSDTLSRLINGRTRSRVAIVGDSLRFEINPALELGLFAVHIKRPLLWKFAQTPPISANYHEAHDLVAASALLKNHFFTMDN